MNVHSSNKPRMILAAALVFMSICFLPLVSAGESQEQTKPVKIEAAVESAAYFGGNQRAIREQRLQDVKTLNSAITKSKFLAWLKYLGEVEAARQEAAKKAAAEAAEKIKPKVTGRSTQGNGQCGGNLPPCCVMNRESGGSLTAKNPTSTASGKWQFLDSTWGGYGGYAHASDAPESVQDARAAQLWAGGSGASHWGGGC